MKTLAVDIFFLFCPHFLMLALILNCIFKSSPKHSVCVCVRNALNILMIFFFFLAGICFVSWCAPPAIDPWKSKTCVLYSAVDRNVYQVICACANRAWYTNKKGTYSFDSPPVCPKRSEPEGMFSSFSDVLNIVLQNQSRACHNLFILMKMLTHYLWYQSFRELN